MAETVVKDVKVKDAQVETMNRTLEYTISLVEKHKQIREEKAYHDRLLCYTKNSIEKGANNLEEKKLKEFLNMYGSRLCSL